MAPELLRPKILILQRTLRLARRPRTENPKPHEQTVKSYWLAARPYSLTASIVPVCLGTAFAKLFNNYYLVVSSDFWLRFVLLLIGCLAVQVLSNLVNDLVDFKTGLDSKENSTKFKALVSGALSWSQMLRFTIVIGLISAAIGCYFIWIVRGPILWLVAIGGVLAIEYTAPPLKLKYRALGDLAVLLAFGLGMIFGCYVVMSHGVSQALDTGNLLGLLGFALPNALLVVAILQANNHRDRQGDRDAGANTLANTLSFKASKRLLYALLIVPYSYIAIGNVVTFFVFGPICLFSLGVLFTLPILFRILEALQRDDYRRTVPDVAKLHGAFGLLLTIGAIIQIFLDHSHFYAPIG